MITNETRTSIKKIYGMLWDVLALYERTEMYNKLPEDVIDKIYESYLNIDEKHYVLRRKRENLT